MPALRDKQKAKVLLSLVALPSLWLCRFKVDVEVTLCDCVEVTVSDSSDRSPGFQSP